MNEESTRMQLYLRPASINDAKELFLWRNNPDTRRQSLSTDEVPWEVHVAWLQKSLQMPARKLYIAEEGGVPIGTVRADKEGDVWELSWTTAPGARNKGFGKAMVLQFVQAQLRGEKIIARIKKDNLASESIAKALGLSPGMKKDETVLWK